MFLQELWGAEYFAKFAIFNDGLLGALFLFVFFWSFTYLSMRGIREDSVESASSVLLPPFVVALFLFASGIHPFFAGMLVVIAYLITVKLVLKPVTEKWIADAIFIVIMLLIFSFVDNISRWILFCLFLIISYFAGERRLKDKKAPKEKKSKK